MPGETKTEKRARQLAAIKALHGILRPKPGDPTFGETVARRKAEERAIEQRHEDFPMGVGAGKPPVAAEGRASIRRVQRKAPRR